MKRLLDCSASDFRSMNGQALKQSIKASEGRVIVAEVISSLPPLYGGVSNVEIAAAFGADLILLNLFDVYKPFISGMQTDDPRKLIERSKALVGRPIGLNLEPVDLQAKQLEQFAHVPEGRIATESSLREVQRLGFDFVCLTGNPKTGVSNREITKAIQLARQILGEEALIFAGKMHAAGVAGEHGEEIIAQSDVTSFMEAGADIILIPSPGTVPGITVESAQQMVRYVHKQGGLALLTIGTSQEGADAGTIRQIALASKMAGADLYHIGDSGYSGIAIPENIMTYSIAVRGKRHTMVRMASSPLR